MISIRTKKEMAVTTVKAGFKTGFLNFSMKVDYGMFLMAQLALDDGLQPLSLKDVAKKNGLSFYFLQKVAVDLRKAGLISAVRGKMGGYRIAKKPVDISMKEILEAIEGPVALLSCVSKTHEDNCSRSKTCVIKRGLSLINDQIIRSLEGFSLFNFLNPDEYTKKVSEN